MLVAVLLLSLLPLGLGVVDRGGSDGVDSWVTDLHTDQRLERQAELGWHRGAGEPGAIVVDPNRRYQTMVGFGASMTDSSAYLLSRLPASTRRSIMGDLFDPETGIGLSMLRQPLGASDFAVGAAYSYDDQPAGQTDADLADFSIDRDRAYLLPRLREAYEINPAISFMATPWSAPGWMKTSDSLITGSLRPEFHQTYARYLVEFVRAYASEGIPTDYLSMQNEPLYEPEDYPGMLVLPDQAATFLGQSLGPALDQAGLTDTAILGYDHNWDIPAYPEAIYADPLAATRVRGTAWHCYSGTVSSQSVSHNSYPHAQSFLTECSGGEWQGTQTQAFDLTMGAVIGVPRHWGQAAILWNLALDERNGPFIGGCRTCRGVVTVADDGTVTKNLEYWALGHVSGFVTPGAVRIGSSQPAGSPVSNVAFRNPDGSVIVVAHNGAPERQTFDIRLGRRHVTVTLAAGAAGTYRFQPPDQVASAADLGWADLDFGRGPAGTPTGRLTAGVGAEQLDAMSQVLVGGRWLVYGLPYGAELQRSGAATDLDRTRWTLTADGVTPIERDPLTNMLDGDPRTHWSSGAGQSDAMRLTVDLGAVQTFTEVSLDVGERIGDFLRSHDVEISDDGVHWRRIAGGPGRPGEMIIALPTTTARYLRLSSAAAAVSWWSIGELELRRADPSVGRRSVIRPHLIRDDGTLPDGSRVVGYYNGGPSIQTVPWPVSGFGYEYRLPPTAAAIMVVTEQ